MKNHYRFLALLISCILAGASPMSALCSETAPAGETAESAEEVSAVETETSAEVEPGIEAWEKEPSEAIAEEAGETGAEAGTPEAGEGTDGAAGITEAGEGTDGAAGIPEAGIEEPEDEPEEAAPVTEGYCGEELTWEYRDGALYIEGTGEMYDYDEEILPEWKDYADQIVELHIDKGITLVDGDAFECLKELETIYFEGNEKEWKELEYENDRTEEELEQYHEGTAEKEETGTVGEEGTKGAFAGVTEYNFGEEAPGEEETAEETGEEAETAEVPEETAEASEAGAAMASAESLQIVTEPEDISAAVGENVSLHVEANMEADFQWQWSRDGKTWKDCMSEGNDTDTFSFEMKDTLNGRHYRCVVMSGSEQLISEEAVVRVAAEALRITSQPDDMTAAAGQTVSFHVEANKAGVTYKWQWRANGTTWKDCKSTGFNTDTLSFEMRDTYDGRQYRCIITSGSEQVTSREAAVSFAGGLEITSQPEDTSVTAGQTAVFHVETNKDGVTYKWQWRADSSAAWKDCRSTGFNTDTLSFEMRDTYDGRQYRCIITSGSEQVTSREATVSFMEGLRITEQPGNVSAAAGETVNFHVAVNKTDVTYRWQWSANGTTWKNCSSAGYNTDTMHFEMRDTYDGRQYRCIITSGTEQVTSAAAAVTFAGELEIVTQPEDVKAEEGEEVSFHVETSRTDVTYQWQWSADGTTWKNCASAGYNTDTMHFVMREKFGGRQYRCIVTAGTQNETSKESFTN